MSDLTTLNRVRYSGLDFDSTEDELRARLQVQFAASFNDFSVSSLGIVLLDIVSFGLDTLSFYLDRRATDTFLATARSRSSVALLTRQLGYKMRAAVAASTDLTVAPAAAHAFGIPIPKGFQFQGPNGIVFEAAQATSYGISSTTPQTIPVYQGQTITETFTSDGTANQVFQLRRVPANSFIAAGSAVVAVNAAPFSESEFISFDATDQFEVGYNDAPPTVRFGDGVAGNIPVQGGSIVVTYVASLGAGGQCLAGTITAVVTPLIVLFQQIDLTITNPQNTVGGSDAEDLDHAKLFAPQVFKSRRVAITQGDYEALAGSYADPLFGRVAIAKAISARSAVGDVLLQNYLIDIESQVETASVAIASALNDPTNGAYALINGSGSLASVLPSVAVISARLTLAMTKIGTINTNLTVAQTNARSSKSNAAQVSVNYGDAHASVTNGRTAVDAVVTALSDSLTTATKTALKNYFNQIDGVLTSIQSLAVTIASASDTTSQALSLVQTSIAKDLGVDLVTAGTIFADIQANNVLIKTATGTTGVTTGRNLLAQLNAIGVASVFGQGQVDADVAAINQHLDTVLSNDCKANLVAVPILARDASGFYAPPSIGLIRSLQGYLNGIKEVTQTVSVASGVNFLIPAVITVRIGVLSNVSLQITQSTATTVVDSILRDRSFGVSLYVSDLYTPLSAITGVAFCNVTIVGYRPTGSLVILADKKDAQGNLIIDANEVITLSQPDFLVTVEVFKPL